MENEKFVSLCFEAEGEPILRAWRKIHAIRKTADDFTFWGDDGVSRSGELTFNGVGYVGIFRATKIPFGQIYIQANTVDAAVRLFDGLETGLDVPAPEWDAYENSVHENGKVSWMKF